MPAKTTRAALLRGMAQGAVESLAAQIALADGRPDDAVAAQLRAIAHNKAADANEPPLMGAGARPALGDLQLRAGLAAAAEQTFRADLAARPASGWSLRGLQHSLAAQGKHAEAQTVAAALQRDWPNADAALKTPGLAAQQ